MARMRVSSKNICSVRQSPIPSAPKARAWRASAGGSALARTLMRRKPSAHCITGVKSSERLGLARGRAALDDLPRRAVDGHHIALVQKGAAGGKRFPLKIDHDSRGAEH